MTSGSVQSLYPVVPLVLVRGGKRDAVSLLNCIEVILSVTVHVCNMSEAGEISLSSQILLYRLGKVSGVCNQVSEQLDWT